MLARALLARTGEKSLSAANPRRRRLGMSERSDEALSIIPDTIAAIDHYGECDKHEEDDYEVIQ